MVFSYFPMFFWCFPMIFPCFTYDFLNVCLPWFSNMFPIIFLYIFLWLYFPISFSNMFSISSHNFPPIFPNPPRHPSRAVLRRQVRQALHLLCQVLQLLCVARRLPGGKTVGRSIGITVGKTLVGSWLNYGYYMMAISLWLMIIGNYSEIILPKWLWLKNPWIILKYIIING